MEERLLLYSLKSAVAHPPLWLRLRKEANSMFESNHTSGNIEEDMKEIKLYFKDFKGKHPELFTIGELNG